MELFYLTIWIIIGIGALLIDLTTSSFLFIWFTGGSITAIIALILGKSFAVQLITFIVVSAVLMAVGYPIVKKTIKKTIPKTKTMEQNYIGEIFVADKDISRKGLIKVDGIYWTVLNEDEYIKKGQKFQVTAIKGTKLVIKKV